MTNDSFTCPNSIGTTFSTNSATTTALATSSSIVHISHANLDRFLRLQSTLASPHTTHASSSSVDTYIASSRPRIIDFGASSYMVILGTNLFLYISDKYRLV